MPSFTQDGTVYEYLKPLGFKSHDDVHSWEHGRHPKVLAAASPRPILACKTWTGTLA